MDALWIFASIIIAVILIVIVINLLRATTHVVPEERRLVVYRLGRFNRIVGPGMVQVMPGLEQVVRTLEVRDHPLEVTVQGIFAFGVPNDLTLNLWCSFDLEEAAGKDQRKLAKLVHLSDAERRHQVEVKMREALVNQLAILQKEMPLPPDSTSLDGVIALAPGMERYNKLLEGVQKELGKSLPSVGVILNTSQPITLTGRGIPPAIIEAIQRRQGRDIDSDWLTRYAEELRQQFPDISKAVLAQILAAIEGVDAGKVQRLLLEQETKTSSDVEIEYEVHEDGEGSPHAIVKPKIKTQVAPEEPAAKSQSARRPEPVAADAIHLSKSDLSVLKRVPRPNSQEQQRKSA
jgi:hypothetical protein